MQASDSEHLANVLQALKTWDAMDALDALVEFGCDGDELQRLLVSLRKADATEPWPRKRLENLSAALQTIADDVGQLIYWGKSRNLGLSGDSETWLETR